MSVLRSSFALLPTSVRRPIRQAVRRWQLNKPRAADTLIRDNFHDLRPLKVVPSASQRPYLTVVTDSVAPAQLLGGVGTAVLLAARIAKQHGRALRIVTREVPSDDAAVRALLKLQRVGYDDPIDLIFSDGSDQTASVPLGEDDIVLTTSWWGTSSTRRTVPAHQIVYLLQEDERMFYPGGDQQLLCDETLNDTEVRYVINSGLLMQHFHDTGTCGPMMNGIAFEPAFPEHIYYPEPKGEKLNLVFYARPGHPRNLFVRGVETLRHAFAAGLFPADRWNVHFFGIDVPNLVFADRSIQVHNGLSWAEYAALMRQADLGFSLMYTPHPSYPPLDLAASGAVVVTNRFGLKGRDRHYCDNIIYSALDVPALVEALREGIDRAGDLPARRSAHAAAKLNRSWEEAFAPVLTTLDLAPRPTVAA